MLLLLEFHCPALYFAKAMLCARLLSLLYELKTWKCLNELQNCLLSLCKSKSPKILKFLRRQNWFENLYRKICAGTFQNKKSKQLQTSFQFVEWIENICEYWTSHRLQKKWSLQIAVKPHFCRKRKSLKLNDTAFSICICFSFLPTDNSNSFIKMKHWYSC